MSKLQDFEKILGAFMTHWDETKQDGEPSLRDFWIWAKYSHPYYEEHLGKESSENGK